MVQPLESLRLRIRSHVQNLGDKDIANKAWQDAELAVKQITNNKDLHACTHEIFADIEKAPPKARGLRFRLVGIALGSNARSASISTPALVLKYLTAQLGHEKNDHALHEMTYLVQSLTKVILTSSVFENSENEDTEVTARLVIPLLKAGVGGSSKARAAAACLLLDGVPTELVNHLDSPDVLQICNEFLKTMLTFLTSGTLKTSVAEAYVPIRQAVQIIGGHLSYVMVRKLVNICIQATKEKESFQARKNAVALVATLAASVQVQQPTVKGIWKLQQTPALKELVALKPSLLEALEAVKYDKITQVRDEVSKAASELKRIPDSLEDPESRSSPRKGQRSCRTDSQELKEWDTTNKLQAIDLNAVAQPETQDALPSVSSDEKKKSRTRSLSFSGLGDKLNNALKKVVKGSDRNSGARKTDEQPKEQIGLRRQIGDKLVDKHNSVTSSCTSPKSPESPLFSRKPVDRTPQYSEATTSKSSRPNTGQQRRVSRFKAAAPVCFDIPIQVYAPSTPPPIRNESPETFAMQHGFESSPAESYARHDDLADVLDEHSPMQQKPVAPSVPDLRTSYSQEHPLPASPSAIVSSTPVATSPELSAPAPTTTSISNESPVIRGSDNLVKQTPEVLQAESLAASQPASFPSHMMGSVSSGSLGMQLPSISTIPHGVPTLPTISAPISPHLHHHHYPHACALPSQTLPYYMQPQPYGAMMPTMNAASMYTSPHTFFAAPPPGAVPFSQPYASAAPYAAMPPQHPGMLHFPVQDAAVALQHHHLQQHMAVMGYPTYSGTPGTPVMYAMAPGSPVVPHAGLSSSAWAMVPVLMTDPNNPTLQQPLTGTIPSGSPFASTVPVMGHAVSASSVTPQPTQQDQGVLTLKEEVAESKPIHDDHAVKSSESAAYDTHSNPLFDGKKASKINNHHSPSSTGEADSVMSSPDCERYTSKQEGV